MAKKKQNKEPSASEKSEKGHEAIKVLLPIISRVIERSVEDAVANTIRSDIVSGVFGDPEKGEKFDLDAVEKKLSELKIGGRPLPEFIQATSDLIELIKKSAK